MTAVLHAQYSFMHIMALEVVWLEHKALEPLHARIAHALNVNLQRLSSGDRTLRAHLRVDSHGTKFIDAFYAWSDALLGRARELV